jgi:hypothetical protein
MDAVTAQIELDILEKEIESMPNNSSIMNFFIDRNIDPQIAVEIDRIWSKVKIIGSRIYKIGQIIVCQIIKFIERNPNTAIAMAITAAATTLFASIPFLGAILTPLIVASSLIVGIPLAQSLDMAKRGEVTTNNSASAIFIGAVSLAKEFFNLLINIFQTLFSIQEFK